MIDFSHSPYVALFFAFSGIRPSAAKKNDYGPIYCLNIFELAGMWARQQCADIDGKISDGAKFSTTHNQFLFDNNKRFDDVYPVNVLDYLELPASWNRRMLRQQGVFLYDTINYKKMRFQDLEHYLEQTEIDGPYVSPVLTKVLIPHKAGREVMERLEIMGVTATSCSKAMKAL